jgi:hypothetical protein
MDAMLDSLEADPRALGPVGFDGELVQVHAVFQVEIVGGFSDAIETAAAAFDDALKAACVDERALGVNVVVGGPEGLP